MKIGTARTDFVGSGNFALVVVGNHEVAQRLRTVLWFTKKSN